MNDPAARIQWLDYKHAELSFDEFQQFLEAVHSVQETLHVPEALPPLKS